MPSQVADGVRAELERLAGRFPDDLAYAVVYDTTVFVKTSIEEVIHTLVEAFVLVAIVVFLFLGKLRTTLIPIIAVPVSLIGTFAVMLAIGFSANTVSLLALVLAIGIVVDDAIVVVENVERVMEEEPDLSAKEATSKAMGEIVAPDHRDHARAALGVRAGGVHPGHQRPAVPAVRGRRLGVDGDLGDQRAEPQPGAVLDPAASPARTRRAARCATCMGAIDWTRDGYAAIVKRLVRVVGPRSGRAGRDRGRHRRAVQDHADRLPAGRGPGRVLRSDRRCRRAPRSTAPRRLPGRPRRS